MCVLEHFTLKEKRDTLNLVVLIESVNMAIIGHTDSSIPNSNNVTTQ